MKVLIVSAVFPPKVSATSVLLDKLLPDLQKEGIEIDAVTVKEHFSDTDYTIYDSIRVYRANCVLQAPVGIRSAGDFFYKVQNRIRRKFFPPKKNSKLYKPDVVKGFVSKMKQISACKYDCIIALSAYYDAAEAVRRYKERYAKDVPVVLYQVDPLAENSIYQSVPFDLYAYEKDLFTLCSRVLTTPVILSLKEKLGWDVSKVVPLDFPMVLSDEGNKTATRKTDEIKCMYAGYLYGGIRDASFTLDLFSRMRDPRIHLYFVGRGQEELLDRYRKGPLKGRIHLLGEKNSEECDRLLKEADVLINIGNKVNNQVPSKIVHYIGFGKPILNLTAIADCPSLPYMERFPLAKSILEGKVDESLASDTEAWLLDSAGKTLPAEDILARFKDCTPESIAKKIARTLKGIQQ